MTRIKRGTTHVKRRRNILKITKGFMWGRKSKISLAQTASMKAGQHAFMDRRKKKRTRRALWQIKIGAFVREHGFSYSKFIHALKAEQIDLDRKILADLAENNSAVMTGILATLKK